MTKKELAKAIADANGLPSTNVLEIVQKTLDEVIDTLLREGRIELRNFGVFEVKERRPRKARNPRTGDRVDVAAKNVVTFQPGKEMEEQVKKFAKPAETKKKPRKGKAAKAAPAVAPEPSANGTAPSV